jgi:hypothetical protein
VGAEGKKWESPTLYHDDLGVIDYAQEADIEGVKPL